MHLKLLYILLFASLSGCASQVPKSIQTKPEPNISYEKASQNIESVDGKTVRWGGKIISVENKHTSTWIEILFAPLGPFGEPDLDDEYSGRFIARLDGFVDPEIYAQGRRLTVYGVIESNIIKEIDEHPYQFPLVHAQEHHLWPRYLAAHQRYRYPHNYYYPYPYYSRFHRFRFGFPYYYPPYYRFRFRHHYW